MRACVCVPIAVHVCQCARLCVCVSACVCVFDIVGFDKCLCFNTFCISFAHFSFVIFCIVLSEYRGRIFSGLSLKIFIFHFTVFLREIAEKTFSGIKMQAESCCENWNPKVSKMYRTLCIWNGKMRAREREREKGRLKKRERKFFIKRKRDRYLKEDWKN